MMSLKNHIFCSIILEAEILEKLHTLMYMHVAFSNSRFDAHPTLT